MAAVREVRAKSNAQARAAARKASVDKAIEEATGAEKAKLPPRAFFLLGETKATAAAQAEHEWNWSKTKTGWSVGSQAVKFLADFDALVEEAKKDDAPIAVYLGYRWYAVIPPHMLDRLVAGGHVVKMPDPAPLVPA